MGMLMNFPSLPSVPCWFFLLFLTIINQSLSARILGDPSSTHHHIRRSITFYVHDLLAQPSLSPSPFTTKVLNNQIPFPKPLGFFPPAGGIPLPEYPNPNIPTQTLDLPGIGISFPARATFQELELGKVLVIDEDLFQGEFGSVFVGKAQGMYVASSEDGTSHMMAMTVSFVNGEYRDGLRFFGVHRRDDDESHVAVIGGTGKYENANGYATIKTVNLRSNSVGKESEGGGYKVLKFDVFLA